MRLWRAPHNRKNWLFVGNAQGGKTAAILMSLLRTAKAVGIDPRIYFRDVMLRMAAAKPTDRKEFARKLTPAHWKETFGKEVRDHQLEIIERLLAVRAK